MFIKDRNNSIYVHLYADGGIYLLPLDFDRGFQSDAAMLKIELERAANTGAVLYYSVEELEELPDSHSDYNLDLLVNSGLDTQMVHPRPEVYHFYKSFVPYLNDAVEVAVHDVYGLLSEINKAEEQLDEYELGSLEFDRQLIYTDNLRNDYKVSLHCLKKLLSVHKELCVEVEESLRDD